MNWYDIRPYWRSVEREREAKLFEFVILFRIMHGTPSRRRRKFIAGTLR